MSGGQKRRVAIAGILAMNPDILILDEPTAGLDPQGTNEMMSLFKRINESGKTIILVTHDMLSLIHISEPTRQAEISYAVFCLKKKKKKKKHKSNEHK